MRLQFIQKNFNGTCLPLITAEPVGITNLSEKSLISISQNTAMSVSYVKISS